ncbi:TBC1 domain family member 13 isoform X1 [Schistocerca nitens]|uniref:TBC1 domain family member 13 isoform X1 n=1 Tax=Schistocerca nitens TaxID=7011 RepID=UPI002117A780|nr:TBC1 domain family member 13 isoform X1 [Schistocerca nitens]
MILSTNTLFFRIKEFDDLLNSEEIDLKTLRKLCFNGVPDEQGRRALCWKLLLNYLPPTHCTWSETLSRKRELYRQFIEEMIVMPGVADDDDSCRTDVTLTDHPLNLNPDSKWQTFFKDNEVLLQIDKDVRRLCPDISFFQQATDFPCQQVVHSKGVKRLHRRVQHTVLKSANVERKGLGITKIALSIKKAPEDYAPMAEGMEAHWEVVERILFLYAKLNPGQGYVQGMNEIIGPIYYAFASNPDAEWREFAEADCFFCFTNLMGEIRDFFIKSLDEAECGISGMMARLGEQLRKSDLQVWLRLQQLELRPQYYSFRWLTLLLSQEFPLPDVLRIWDSLFADERRFDFLIYICCSMIILLREELLTGDFPSNVKLLQNFPSMDIQVVLSKAAELGGLKAS